MTTPPLFPDIEAVLVPWLSQQMLAVYGVQVRTCSETPLNLEDVVPVVAVYRAAGLDLMAIIDRPVVDVDCFAATRAAAQLLGTQVSVLLHRYLPGTVTGPPSAVVGLVSTVKGPAWLTYEDLAVRRCNATYEIYTHAVPA